MNRKFTVFLTAAVLLLGVVGSAGAQGVTPQTLLPGALIPKFVDPLPVAGDITVVNATVATAPAAPPTGNPYNPYNITMSEFKANILPASAPTVPAYTGSWVWGYLTDTDSTATPRPSYLGPVKGLVGRQEPLHVGIYSEGQRVDVRRPGLDARPSHDHGTQVARTRSRCAVTGGQVAPDP